MTAVELDIRRWMGAGWNAKVDESWRDHAACADKDPDLFFTGENPSVTRRAKLICEECPVRDACLQYAITIDVRFGVWGGLSEREREKLTGKRRAWLSK